MRVNFNQTFKDYRGNDLLVNGRPQIMGHIVAQCLFNGDGVKPSGITQKTVAQTATVFYFQTLTTQQADKQHTYIGLKVSFSA